MDKSLNITHVWMICFKQVDSIYVINVTYVLNHRNEEKRISFVHKGNNFNNISYPSPVIFLSKNLSVCDSCKYIICIFKAKSGFNVKQ
jgi:hypothetical protein